MAAFAPTGEQVLSADAVTDALRDLILTGQLGIGVQLKQQALAVELLEKHIEHTQRALLS